MTVIVCNIATQFNEVIIKCNTMIQEQPMTQKEIIGKALKELKPNVTAEDRKAYMLEYGCTPGSIVWYLNGDVKDADTGVQILEFFSKRIAERNEKINNAKAL